MFILQIFLNCCLRRLTEASLSLWFEKVMGSICCWTTIVVGTIVWLIMWCFADAFCLLRPPAEWWQGRSPWGTLGINAMLIGEHLWWDLSKVCGLLLLYLRGLNSFPSGSTTNFFYLDLQLQGQIQNVLCVSVACFDWSGGTFSRQRCTKTETFFLCFFHAQTTTLVKTIPVYTDPRKRCILLRGQ